MKPGKLWMMLFSVWLLLLSGALASFVGSPGAIQAFRLKALLESKQAQAGQIEDAVFSLQTEAARLERSKVAQQREIRRVLGYAAPDELIFDFSAPGSF